jgi:hypothetical protein
MSFPMATDQDMDLCLRSLLRLLCQYPLLRQLYPNSQRLRMGNLRTRCRLSGNHLAICLSCVSICLACAVLLPSQLNPVCNIYVLISGARFRHIKGNNLHAIDVQQVLLLLTSEVKTTDNTFGDNNILQQVTGKGEQNLSFDLSLAGPQVHHYV